MISRIVSSIVVMVAIALAGTASLLAQSAPNPKVDSLKDMEELEKHVQEIIAKARPAVVGIFAGGGGSGTLISEDGWIATAAHVTGVTAGAPVQIVLADGTSMPGTVRGTHMAMDYALIKVEPKEGQKFPYVELGDSGALVKGQWVLAMGHPLGTEGGRGPVVRLGRVINPRMIPSTFVHVDAPLISGDSGGPIFDLGGNLVAINQSIGTQDVRQNMTTPVNGMKEILDQLKDDQALGRAQNYGVGGGVQSEMSPEDMEDYQAAMQKLTSGGPREEAANELAELAEREKMPSDVYYNAACAFSLWSGELSGEEKEAKAKLAVKYLQASFDAGWGDLIHIEGDTDLDSIREREDFKAAIDALKKKNFKPVFGVRITPATSGVTVAGILKDSIAEASGFRAGDVITAINGKPVTNAIDYANAIASADLASATMFSVKRDATDMTIEVNFGGNNDAGPALAGLEKNDKSLLELWEKHTKSLSPAVFAVLQGGTKSVAFATAVSHDGYLVTKASELDASKEIELRDDDGAKIKAVIAATDEPSDIALLKVERKLESIVDFNFTGEDPVIGTMLSSVRANGDAFTYGIVALPGGYNSTAMGERAYVGVNGETASGGGFTVTVVAPGSPGEKAGLEVGDKILAIDGEPIADFFTAVTMIQSKKPGTIVTLEGERDGQPLRIDVTVGKRSEIEGAPFQPQLPPETDTIPKPPSATQGGPLLGFRGKTSEAKDGVEVTSTERSGPAEDAGLKVGDRVVGLGSEAVTSNDDLKAAIAGKNPGDTLQLRFVREGAEMSGNLILGEKIDGDPVVGVNLDPTVEEVTVVGVVPGGPADIAGLEEGDIITAMDGYAIASLEDLRNELSQRRPRQTVTLAITRNGEKKNIDLTLGSRDEMPTEPRQQPGDDSQSKPSIGMTLKERDDGKGLDVTAVKDGSPASKAKIEVGDIVLRVNNTAVNSLDDFKKILESAGPALQVRYKRGDERFDTVIQLGGGRAGPGGGRQGRPGQQGAPGQPPMDQIKGETSKRADGFGAVIQHDGVVKPAECGGPIIDLDGNVRGLNIARSDRTRTFALPATRVKEVVESLIAQAGK